MTRKVSSRDDLFLSAADLYMLLSFVFIGFALVQAQGGNDGALASVDLPAVRRGTAPAPLETTLTIAWEAASLAPDPYQGRCRIEVKAAPPDVGKLLGKNVPSPCKPRSFGFILSAEESSALARLHHVADSVEEGKRQVVIQCPVAQRDPALRDEALLACARLQWIMIDAGFQPLALVEQEP